MRNKKKCAFVTGLKRLVVAGVVAAMVTVSMGNVWDDGIVTASAATSKIKIDKNTFPNFRFRAYVKTNFDTNKDGYLSASEIKKVKKITIKNQEVVSFKGIQYFTYLTEFNCNGTDVRSLDLSKNKKLKVLYCDSNGLTRLDVSANTELETLTCMSNKLTRLDVSKNKKLGKLYCGDNKLISIDVSKNTKLKYLSCLSNSLTSLDVSKNKELIVLNAQYNKLRKLTLTGASSLMDLDCSKNQLVTLNVRDCRNLRNLKCFGNKITTLDLRKNRLITVRNGNVKADSGVIVYINY